MNARKLIPLLVVATGLLAYQNTFTNPFLFDDVATIPGNSSIRHLWPVWPALMPPHKGGTTVEGRPIVSLSFAINYAIDGARVWGYHAVNLAIHIAAALVLFGITRRTLLQPPLRERFGGAAEPLALVITLIWVVHPLQTESVTYVVQRCESMMGLFYLLTLYCVIRGAESAIIQEGRNGRVVDSSLPMAQSREGGGSAGASPSRSLGWFCLSVASCLLGMASKEVMVSAPLIVLLYDRTFLGGSFTEAWRRRWRLYSALAATWILLAWLVITTGTRGGTAGIGAGMAWTAYGLTQLQAIPHYLRLSFWPQPLVFDYGTGLAGDVGDVLPGALVVAVLLMGTVVALRRWPPAGFLGAWFFAILAPTSSVVPVASQTIAEHRLYLPLAAVIAASVLGAFVLGKRLLNHPQGVVLGSLAGATVVMLFSFLTFQRNRDYRSSWTIWRDTVDKCPDNPRAHDNLGIALREQGRLPEAIDQYQQALRLKPDYAPTRYNLGIALLGLGRRQEAMELWEQALQIKPGLVEAHYNLGNALYQSGKVPEAIRHYEQALRIEPDLAEAHYNLALAYEQDGRLQQAIQHYQQALRINPDFVKARTALAQAQARTVE